MLYWPTKFKIAYVATFPGSIEDTEKSGTKQHGKGQMEEIFSFLPQIYVHSECRLHFKQTEDT